jgi:5-methylcytosine-specific restriction protein A
MPSHNGEALMTLHNEEPSEQDIRKEKEKARKLRKSEWWLSKINSGICHYCGRHVGRDQLTMDHVAPLSRGGKSKKGNIVAACKECNNKKKYLLPVEWDAYLDTLRNQSVD